MTYGDKSSGDRTARISVMSEAPHVVRKRGWRRNSKSKGKLLFLRLKGKLLTETRVAK
jgi:hypothetical protein